LRFIRLDRSTLGCHVLGDSCWVLGAAPSTKQSSPSTHHQAPFSFVL
jgi:hypothetical protein